MDLHIRNYILYKTRNLNEQKKVLQKLKKHYEEMKQDIIDETTGVMDGQPRGKGQISDPTQAKVIRFEQLDKRIKNIENELDVFKKFEEKVTIMGSLTRRIYNDTIKGQSNLEYKAMEYGMATKTLYNYRGKLLEMLATDLGEYIDLEKIL